MTTDVHGEQLSDMFRPMNVRPEAYVRGLQLLHYYLGAQSVQHHDCPYGECLIPRPSFAGIPVIDRFPGDHPDVATTYYGDAIADILTAAKGNGFDTDAIVLRAKMYLYEESEEELWDGRTPPEDMEIEDLTP